MTDEPRYSESEFRERLAQQHGALRDLIAQSIKRRSVPALSLLRELPDGSFGLEISELVAEVSADVVDAVIRAVYRLP